MKEPPMKKRPKLSPKRRRPNGFLMFLVLVLAFAGIFSLFSSEGTPQGAEEISVTRMYDMYTKKELKKMTIDGNILKAENQDGMVFKMILPPGTTLKDLDLFDPATIDTQVSVKDKTIENAVKNMLFSIVPFILIVIVILFILKQAQGSANSAFTFGQSRARLHDKEKHKTTFDDVAGAAEAKEDLKDIVDFLKYPKKYTKMGAKIPKGVLLYGSPGTGKTLLSRAVAGEADVPFFSISGSEFVEMFVGVGASRVRDLFKKAKRSAPSIVFIDEIDAVGRHRGAGMGGGHDEREQTLNQILTEMDGFELDTNVIVIAATNRPDILDPALLRPGRFDRRIVIDRPNVIEREEILRVHARKKPLEKDIDMEKLAKKIPGFTGADIENLLNEAAILAAKEDKKEISWSDIDEAVERVTIGPEKKSRRLNKEEKKITTYHELGHAVVGHLLPYADPVHKVSIISRGMALGVTTFLPSEDTHLSPKIKFEQELCVYVGGRVAEEIFFGADKITTGASNDLERATDVARNMVTQYGMSDVIGPVVLETKKNVFLGRDLGERALYSQDTSKLVDAEVKRILESAMDGARKIVKDNESLFHEMAEALLKKEELSEDEFKAFFTKHKIKVPKKIAEDPDTKAEKKKETGKKDKKKKA